MNYPDVSVKYEHVALLEEQFKLKYQFAHNNYTRNIENLQFKS